MPCCTKALSEPKSLPAPLSAIHSKSKVDDKLERAVTACDKIAGGPDLATLMSGRMVLHELAMVPDAFAVLGEQLVVLDSHSVARDATPCVSPRPVVSDSNARNGFTKAWIEDLNVAHADFFKFSFTDVSTWTAVAFDTLAAAVTNATVALAVGALDLALAAGAAFAS